VADFGVARFQDQGGIMTAETGTYRWMAPEVRLFAGTVRLYIKRLCFITW
jgi:hypothetical protein